MPLKPNSASPQLKLKLKHKLKRNLQLTLTPLLQLQLMLISISTASYLYQKQVIAQQQVKCCQRLQRTYPTIVSWAWVQFATDPLWY